MLSMHLKLVFDVYVQVDPAAVPRKHVTAAPALVASDLVAGSLLPDHR